MANPCFSVCFMILYGASFKSAEMSKMANEISKDFRSKYALCEQSINLFDGQTLRCRLEETMNIRISRDNLPSTSPNGLKDTVAFLHTLFRFMKNSFFKTRIAVLCDSPNELDYFHSGSKICEENITSPAWSLAFINSYRECLVNSLRKLGKYDNPAQKTSFCALATPSADFREQSVLSIRRKVPGSHNDVDVTVACQTRFDTETLLLITLFLFLTYFGPTVLCNSVSRMIICIIFGSLAAVMIISFFILRDISRTTLGRISVATAVFFGSLGVLSEGLFRSFIPWFVTTVRNDRSLQIGGIATGVAVVATFRYLNIQKYFMMLSYGILRTLQLGLLVLALTGNAALCISCTAIPVLFCSLAFFIWYVFQKNYGSARESFPSYVYQEASVMTQSCETLSGTPDEKMRKYELEGAIHTRKYLEKLGEDIRSNVNVVTRTNDPNTIAHWAGVTS